MSTDKPHGLDRETVVRGLRRGADLIARGDVAGAVDQVIEQAHVGEAVEHALEGDRGVSRFFPSSPFGPSTIAQAVPAGQAQGESHGSAGAGRSAGPAAPAMQGYTAPTPWSGDLADVVVICCSSEKYEVQNQEFIAALGFRMPHFIQVPGGPAALYGLAAIKGFLSKAMGLFVAKAVDLLNAKEVICIAHENCGAYTSGNVSVLGDLTRRLSGKPLAEVQIEHLQKSCRELQAQLGRGVTVRAFYASIVTGGQKLIRYEPVEFDSRSSSRR